MHGQEGGWGFVSTVEMKRIKWAHQMEHITHDALHPRQYEKAPLFSDLELNEPAGKMRGFRHFPHEV